MSSEAEGPATVALLTALFHPRDPVYSDQRLPLRKAPPLTAAGETDIPRPTSIHILTLAGAQGGRPCPKLPAALPCISLLLCAHRPSNCGTALQLSITAASSPHPPTGKPFSLCSVSLGLQESPFMHGFIFCRFGYPGQLQPKNILWKIPEIHNS